MHNSDKQGTLPFGLSFLRPRDRNVLVCKRSCVESNHRSSSAMLTCALAHDVQTSFHCHVFEKSHDRICLRKCTRNPHMSPRNVLVCKRSCVESNHRSSSAMLTCAVAHDVQTSFHCHVFEKSHDRICLRKCTRNPHMSPLIIGGSQVVITFPTTLLVLPKVIMVVSTWKADRV